MKTREYTGTRRLVFEMTVECRLRAVCGTEVRIPFSKRRSNDNGNSSPQLGVLL